MLQVDSEYSIRAAILEDSRKRYVKKLHSKEELDRVRNHKEADEKKNKILTAIKEFEQFLMTYKLKRCEEDQQKLNQALIQKQLNII